MVVQQKTGPIEVCALDLARWVALLLPQRGYLRYAGALHIEGAIWVTFFVPL